MAQAQMRCGTRLIEIGDLAAEVLQLCGEPYSRDVTLYGTDQWVYNFGPDEFMMILTLSRGEVTDIEPGDYGFVTPAEPSAQ
jgi:hypothetical protein